MPMNKPLADDERFEYAVNLALAHEGGYVNDQDDMGGETKYGISKRSYPDIDIASLTIEQAKAIYRRDFWEKHRYNKIINITLAAKIFNIAINIGPRRANRLLQRALAATGKRNIIEDGILGIVSLTAVNSVDPLALIEAFKLETANYYKAIVVVRKDQSKFLKGWLDRAYS